MDYGVYESYYYFIIFSRGKIIYGRFLEQPLFIAQTRGATQLALLLDEGVVSSSVYILYLYASVLPPFSFHR